MARKGQPDEIAELNVTPSFFVGHVFYWGDRHRNILMGPHTRRRHQPAPVGTRPQYPMHRP